MQDVEPEEDFLERALSAAFERDSSRAPLPRASVPASAMASETIPATVGRYRIEGVLGRGGMGIVLAAHDPELDRTVALKLLREPLESDPEMVRRFLAEARRGGGLEHPGAVPVHEIGETADGRPYVTMRLVAGTTLAQRLAARTDLARERSAFVAVFEQICQILAYAHARQVSHLDVKPANVLVGEYGDILVTDWGPDPSRVDPDGLPESSRSRIVGTPAYMAPEQARGDLDRLGPATDVFALGAVLLEILTGFPPYAAESTGETLLEASRGWLDRAWERLAPVASEEPELAALIRHCLALEPADRPRDAGEVAREIRRHRLSLDERAHELTIQVAEAGARSLAERKLRRWVVGSALGFALAVVSIAVATTWIQQERAQRAREDEYAAVELAERVRSSVAAAALVDDADPFVWNEPLAAARHALATIRSRAETEDPRRRVAELADTAAARQAAARAQHDAVAQLTHLGERHGDSRDLQSKDREYGEVFRTLGVLAIPNSLEPDATRIGASPIRATLVAALDDWADLRLRILGQESARHISSLAERCDPDPWRCRVRRVHQSADVRATLALADEPARKDQPVQSALLLARSLFAVGERLAGRRVLEEAALEHPASFELHHELGVLLRSGALRNESESIRHFSMAWALRPTSVHIHLDLGQVCLQSGHFEPARGYLERALTLDPNEGSALQYLGILEWRLGHSSAARARLLRSLEVAPDAPQTLSVLGLVERDRGDLTAALPYLRRAADLEPDRVEPWLVLAETLVRAGRQPEALERTRLAVERNPKQVELWYALGNLQSLTDAVSAVASFANAVALDPGHAESWCNRGQLLVDLGRFGEGLDALVRGHELGSARGERWTYPSDAWLARARRLEAAAEELEQLGGPAENELPTMKLVAMAEAALALRRPEIALELSDQAVERLRPRVPSELVALGAMAALAMGTGLGEGALPAPERSAYRERAEEMLEHLLDAMEERAAVDSMETITPVLAQMRRSWVSQESKSAAAQSEWTQPERSRWQSLWERIDALAEAPSARVGH